MQTSIAAGRVFYRLFLAFIVHHRNFRILHAVELVAIGQVGVAGVGLIVAVVIGFSGQQVMFGGGTEIRTII